MEQDLISPVPPTSPRLSPTGTALLVGLIAFVLLWLANAPFRRAYWANDNDVTALVDGMLLLPGAHWQDWFTNGHSHFFDSYPEWPWGLTPFARPAFQCLIYLAHFVFGRDWAAYLAVNYLAVAGMGAIAFVIARVPLGLGNAASALAAALVLISSAVLEFSIWELGFASESMASVLIGAAFLAVIARRDIACAALLLLALLTKETAAWAPFAAALSVLLRWEPNVAHLRRALVAAAMLLPLAVWLGLRFAFFQGIGGSYATGGYTPITEFLTVVGWKLIHLYRLFVSQETFAAAGPWATVDRVLMLATYSLIALLLIPWASAGIRMASARLDQSVRGREWPTVDAALLVTIWAALGLAFYFAVPIVSPRYAAAAVMFLWPAVVAEVARRRQRAFYLALAASFVLMLPRTAHLLISLNPPSEQSYLGRFLRDIGDMDTVLRRVPPGIGQVYVLSSGGLVTATPEYLRVFLDVPIEIIRVVDLHSACRGGERFVTVDHKVAGGVVTLDVTTPDCASLFFDMAGQGSTLLAGGGLRRNDSISYELPEARVIDHQGPLKPALELGRRMTVHIRPRGRARFIIEHGGPDGRTIWFDIP